MPADLRVRQGCLLFVQPQTEPRYPAMSRTIRTNRQSTSQQTDYLGRENTAVRRCGMGCSDDVLPNCLPTTTCARDSLNFRAIWGRTAATRHSSLMRFQFGRDSSAVSCQIEANRSARRKPRAGSLSLGSDNLDVSVRRLRSGLSPRSIGSTPPRNERLPNRRNSRTS